MTIDAASWMQEVMCDASWTRRLAGALLGDKGAADDAFQEAWLKTAKAARPVLDNRRGWVRAIVANTLLRLLTP